MSRKAWIIGFAVVALLIVSLYRAKYGARESAREIARLNTEIDQLEDEIRVLRNEYAYLSDPKWVAEYATKVLGMAPARAGQIVGEDEVAEMAAAWATEQEKAQEAGEGASDGDR